MRWSSVWTDGRCPLDDTTLKLHADERLLFFSDGAIEIHNAENKMLGIDGLIAILKKLGYPKSGIQITAVEEALLRYLNSIRLEDDLTLIEMPLPNESAIIRSPVLHLSGSADQISHNDGDGHQTLIP